MGGSANADSEAWSALTAAEEPAYGAWQDDSASLEAFGGSLAEGPPDANVATDAQVASDAGSNASPRSEGSPASDDSAPPKACGASSNIQAESGAAVVKEAVVEGTDGPREELDLPSPTRSSRRAS
ncbi:hypothetical protein CB0940_08134 [Cercospora beticola]|uniref:Uncharacterized protein n=1 Tax=Cercospora beticola TaxID=122368 RepID=A0A2G5HR60_CERBT|nr:hypothetical protein CB0940_08134 [Cercospora beticola]PIA95008.1 hypothetical protein CB0940_08134 [Cercospora beticola]WPB04700.1 hypothetical protein RHO25_009347 [Cercospora beticola]